MMGWNVFTNLHLNIPINIVSDNSQPRPEGDRTEKNIRPPEIREEKQEDKANWPREGIWAFAHRKHKKWISQV